jgi:hypothetical protein
VLRGRVSALSVPPVMPVIRGQRCSGAVVSGGRDVVPIMVEGSLTPSWKEADEWSASRRPESVGRRLSWLREEELWLAGAKLAVQSPLADKVAVPIGARVSKFLGPRRNAGGGFERRQDREILRMASHNAVMNLRTSSVVLVVSTRRGDGRLIAERGRSVLKDVQ